MKASMTESDDPAKMYVNILGFKSKEEQKLIFLKVKEVIQRHQTKTRVF